MARAALALALASRRATVYLWNTARSQPLDPGWLNQPSARGSAVLFSAGCILLTMLTGCGS